MNKVALKDTKVVSGFISSIILSVIALVLAINNISYWVVALLVSLVVSMLSVYRVDKLDKEKK